VWNTPGPSIRPTAKGNAPTGVLIYLFRTRQQNNITAAGFYKKKREDSTDQKGSLYAAGAHLNSAHTCDLRNERAWKEKMASAQILRRSPSDDEILQSRLSATCSSFNNLRPPPWQRKILLWTGWSLLRYKPYVIDGGKSVHLYIQKIILNAFRKAKFVIISIDFFLQN
jgi:hypothetical protein